MQRLKLGAIKHAIFKIQTGISVWVHAKRFEVLVKQLVFARLILLELDFLKHRHVTHLFQAVV